jgi:hypothetical protein
MADGLAGSDLYFTEQDAACRGLLSLRHSCRFMFLYLVGGQPRST